MVRDEIIWLFLPHNVAKISYFGLKYYSNMLGIIIFALTYIFFGIIIFGPLVYFVGSDSLRPNNTSELSQ